MSVARLLKKFGQTSLARPTSTDGRSSSSADDPNNLPHRQQGEAMPTFSRPWRKKRPSTTGHSGVSLQKSASPLIPGAEDSASEHAVVHETSPQMALPTTSSVLSTFPMTEPPPKIVSAVVPLPDKLAEAWNVVRVDREFANSSRGILSVASTIEDNAAPFIPIVKATIETAQQFDLEKTIKEGIETFSESIPVFIKALDELKSLHPFIGVAVLAFQTVYTLERKRRDNDRKITSLFVGMRDMMGALFLLKGMENDKLTAPDGVDIEDRLKSLVDRTADDIKMCANVCDAYIKKRPLAKALMSPVWDAKLLCFVQLFATRRKEFEFELTLHTSRGVDTANAKLDAIEETTRSLNEQMNIMKALFQELASPAQKRLSELVALKGGVKTLKDDDKVLLELEKAEYEAASGEPKAEVGHTRREHPRDTNIRASANNLRRDIFEDPNFAVEKNLIVFSRKFEAQKNQIIDELTLVVKRESDRVIQEVKGGPHERILDRGIHEIWTEMAWRGNVKARHFVLALRDYYLENLASGAENVLDMGTTTFNCSPDPDAWAIKYIDIARLQPIREAIDDDASGFITIGEINRFTASRPINWSLPHWVAFWAVGYRAAIINYACKIKMLFAKMAGIRTEVLPFNQQAIIKYFTYNHNWASVHILIAPLLSLQPGIDDLEKFRPYIEAEEARLENNLRAVDYVIDGMDTLTLITGMGRIEKTVFPLLYLLMKRHFEIMRIMRTKVLDPREILEGMKSIYHIHCALKYRADDLTNHFSQQKLDIEKQFQNFAYGMFRYIHDPSALWSADYVLGLDPQIVPYDDANEDQTVKAEDILKFESLEELSLDDWVYDGHSIDDVPSYGDVGWPLKDILGHWHGYIYETGGVRDIRGADSMMTFVLEPAEGDNDLKANGWFIRGRFTIAGSWSMGKNDLMQLRFKMTFKNVSMYPIFFNGHFDPERHALTGVWGSSAEPESFLGLLEFRRIPPRYLTVYPSIKELLDNKPRALWKFAIAAVRNDIRQQRCPWSYFAQRRDDRQTVVSSVVRYHHFGKPLDDEEIQKLIAAIERLTSTDAYFYSSMINRKIAHVLTHGGTYCDSCGGYIAGARLFCLDCVNNLKSGKTFDTLDLCCSPESRCIDARVTYREDLTGPHEPFHKLVKVRVMVLPNHLGHTHKLACAAFKRVEILLLTMAGASQQSQEEKRTAKDVWDASTEDLITTKRPSQSDMPGDIWHDEADGSLGGTEPKPTITGMLSKCDKSDDVPAAVDGIGNGADAELSIPKVPSKSGNVPTAMDGTDDKAETENKMDKASKAAPQAQGQDGNLPTCGECDGSLSFPFWYCIFCEDNLFICDACDAKGVPDLVRASGKHTEEHHLVRCLKPEKVDGAVSSPDQRLISIEGRLADIQMQFTDMMQTQSSGIQSQFTGIQAQVADMQTQFNNLAARIGNIEELLHKLAGTSKRE